MPPIIANDILRVTMIGDLSGQSCVNVFDFRADRPISPGNSLEWATLVRDAWQDDVLDRCPTNYTFLEARYIDLDSLTGDHGALPPNPAKPIVGSGTGEPNPPQCAVLVTKVLASGAPRGLSGRFYLPPCSEEATDNAGMMSTTEAAAYATTLGAFWDKITRDGVGESEIWPVVTSFPRDSEGKINGPGTGYDIASFQVQRRMATQRRRIR